MIYDRSKRSFIFMIDELLRSEIHSCFSRDDIREYAKSKGVEWIEYGIGSVKESVDHTIDDARREIERCLKSFCLDIIKIKKNGSTYMYGYPDEVFEQNIDVIAKHREKSKSLRKSQIEDIITRSKGLLPDSIIADVLLKDKNVKRTFIEFESQFLLNIDLLSKLYFAVRDKQVIAFDYCAYGEANVHVILHPHYIREYNNRWYVYGYTLQNGGAFPVNNYPVDRINSATVFIQDDIKYIEPQVDYESYFNNFVGANKPKNGKPVEIIIRTNDKKIHGLVSTKKLHSSQQTIQTWDDKTHSGRILLKVIPTVELRGRILSFGKGLTIEKPSWLADKYRQEIQSLLESYNLSNDNNPEEKQ